MTRSVVGAPLLVLLALLAQPQDAIGQTRAPAGCPGDLEILIERSFASDRGITPGAELLLRAGPDSDGCAARVAGIFEPPPDPSRLTVERPRILLHVPHLAALTGRDAEVDHFTLSLSPGIDAATMAAELAPLLPGTQVLTTHELAEETSTTFLVVSRFHRAIGIITLIAGGVFLSCIMILKVQERRTPIAAARLVGIPRRTLLGWTVAEAAVVSTVGGLLGLGLGLTASAVINAFYQRAYDTTLVFSRVTTETVIQALVLAVILGMAAGVYAGVRLFSADALAEVGR